MTGRTAATALSATFAAAMTWVAILSWRGLVEEPYRFTGPALTAAILVAGIGAGLRSLRLPWYAVLGAQVVVLLSWFQHRRGTDAVLGGWLPTPHGVSALFDEIRAGAEQVNRYAAPVDQVHSMTTVYLLAVSIVLLLAVDTLGCGLGRAPWAGLPVLVALTVPISVLDDGLDWGIFVLVGVLFTLLLASVEAEQTLAWGQTVTGERRPTGEPVALDRLVAIAPALRIGVTTAVAALVLPALVPVGGNLLERGDGAGDGGSGEANRLVVLTNPMVDLRRDLRRSEKRLLLRVVTDAPRPEYVRLTVLDRFTGSSWEPSARDLDGTAPAEGPLADPVGVTSSTAGSTSTWNLATADDFATRWLPTPYVTQAISIDRGDWRYDEDTADFVNSDRQAPLGVSYALSAFTPAFDPARLGRAPQPVDRVRRPMTRVPQLTEQVADIAREVTADAETDYDKAVALQRWFRTEGGFRYSLEPESGDGMRQLERFLTTDKVGYCEQYAAAMAVLARALDIPSRVVVGFLSPERVNEGRYEFTTDDLHAWPELYFQGSGWVRFEPTPSGRTGNAPAWTTGDAEQPATPTPTATPSVSRPTPAPRPDRVPEATAGTSGTEDAGTGTAPFVLGTVLLLALAAGVPAVLRRRQRARRFRALADGRAEIDALWSELRATAVDLRIAWPEGRTVRAVARVLAQRVGAPPEDDAALRRLVTLVERARYGRAFALTDAEREDARATVRRWSALLAEAQPDRRARRAAVLPRSVFAREQVPVVVEDPERELSARP